jgi:MFS family permease
VPRVPAILREDAPFRLLFAGQALSVVGDRITPVAIAFAVLAIGSPTDLGIVMAAGGIPFGLFAIAGGVLSDRMGRRGVMLASDAVRAASQTLTAALLLSGRAEVWMLAVLSAVYGTSAAVFMPALIGLIPQTVAAGRLQDANALLGVTRSVAGIVGPAVAGLILAGAGPGEAIAVDAATFAVSAACLVALRPRPAAPPGEQVEGFVAQLRAGWHEVRSRGWLRVGLVAMAAYHVLVLPAVFVLGPALSVQELDGADSWATIVTCLGVGTVVGNVVALRLRPRRPVLVAAASLVGACTQAAIIGSGLGTAGIAAGLLLAGVAVSLFFTLWDTSIQEQVPAHAVSRVSSYDFAVSLGLMPLGMALAGPLAGALGLHATLRAMSALGILMALAWLVVPSVRQVRRAPGPPAGATPPGGAAQDGAVLDAADPAPARFDHEADRV